MVGLDADPIQQRERDGGHHLIVDMCCSELRLALFHDGDNLRGSLSVDAA